MNNDLQALRHSCSHIMADAVKQIWPDVKLGIGPAIEDGFYYDFEKEEPFTPEDLEKIEERMQKIIDEDLRFIREELPKGEAIKLFKKLKEDFKLALLDEIPDTSVSIYRHGNFVDLCKGPHIESTGKIEAFKLLNIAGAYWHGIETNPMLQRIYGTAFFTQEDLKKFLELREEAKKRDHRKLGRDLELFSIHDEVGAGLVIYHPKGMVLRTIIEDYEKKEHLKRGYQIVMGPHILKSDIWIRSGHYEYYKENMFIFKVEGSEYAVKPMNCPGHMMIYNSKVRSYRDLPLRYFELGNVYRNEKQGVLHGLLRVRGFTQDDAHIFCLEEQIREEIIGIIDFVIGTMKVFGFNDYIVELSTRPTKSIGTEAMWQKATKALKDSLDKKALPYEINEGEGAFYGPKIDIKLKDALSRPWQCATIQCDFALPERFDLSYISKEGKKERPIMLHRVILGSIERFIGALLEHYAGAFPVWLSPVQVKLISITDRTNEYAENIKIILDNKEIRSEIDLRNERLEYKVREAESQKVPYMLIVGDKEQTENTVSLRARREGNLGTITLEKAIERIEGDIKLRR